MLLLLYHGHRSVAQDEVIIKSGDPYEIWSKVGHYRNSVWTTIRGDRTIASDIASGITIRLKKNKSRTRSPFDQKERTLLRFWQGHYPELLDEAIAWECRHDMFGMVAPWFCCSGMQFSPDDSLGQHLLPFMNARRDHLLAGAEASNRTREEKDFLALHLRYVLADFDLEHFDTEDMQRRTAKYLADYPDSPRARYVSTVLDYRYAPWGMGVGGHLYTGTSIFQGNIATYLNSACFIGVDLEIGYGRLMLKSGFGGGIGRPIKNPFTYNELDYDTDTKVSMSDGEALLGYALVDSKRIRLAPFGGVSECGVRAKDDNGAMTYHGRQAGIDFDLKVDHWDATKNIVTYGSSFMAKQNKGHSALRIRIAYERLFNEHDEARLGGSQFIVRVGYGCYQGAGRRIRTWKR